MPKSKTHAKRRQKLKAKRKTTTAKKAQAEEPREKFSIDDIAGRT